MGRGGKRNGAGRKKGSKEPHTLERERVQEAFNQRVFGIAQNLLERQASLAMGQTFLYRIDKKKESTGKVVVEKPVVVTDPDEISMWLDFEYGDGENPNTDSEYYYMTTKEPNNQAIDSILNRSLGKPKETIEHQGGVSLKLDV